MRDATIHRPVTLPKLAAVLDTKPYRLMAELIKKSIFLAPDVVIDDLIAIELAATLNIRLLIIDDEGDEPAALPLPTNPLSPIVGFRSTTSQPNNARQINT